MQKTIVVRVANLVSHEKYSRVMGRASSFKVHDEQNTAGIGDQVRIMETRPISKDKRWRLVEIIQKASQAPAVPGTEEESAKPARSAKEPASS
jgi:small subunit ribosomal protein S17